MHIFGVFMRQAPILIIHPFDFLSIFEVKASVNFYSIGTSVRLSCVCVCFLSFFCTFCSGSCTSTLTGISNYIWLAPAVASLSNGKGFWVYEASAISLVIPNALECGAKEARKHPHQNNDDSSQCGGSSHGGHSSLFGDTPCLAET